MREIGITIGWKGLPVLAAVLVFVGIIRVLTEGRKDLLILKRFEELGGLLADRGRGMAWYQRTEALLIANGAAEHFGRRIMPASYLAVKILLGSGGLAVFGAMEYVYGVIAFAVLYALPGILLRYLNGRDNERMLPDLKLVYHGLEIQLKAGIYVTDALAECYGCVSEKRLKQALLDLAGDIVMQSDIYRAMDDFQSKFDNRYIDTLCITLLQALESGQAVELLNDLSEQVKDMEIAVINRKKGALDRSLTFYQLGILTAVLGVVLYACVTQMFAAALFF